MNHRHGHERDDGTTLKGAPARPVHTSATTPFAGVTALQQTAGNAAVSRIAGIPTRLQRAVASGAMTMQRLATIVVQRARVSGHRRRHILDGDATGGGHRYGSGAGKSEFPRTWSDDKIIRAIEAVSVDPSATATASYGGKTKIVGVYDGVSIRVIVAGNSVITGFPARN